MSENTSEQCANGCTESPVWAKLEELGLEYERAEI